MGLLRLFMRSVNLAPLAILLQLKSTFEGLLVLMRIIVRPFALRTLELDEIILRHRMILLIAD